jgi:hypothetical protein
MAETIAIEGTIKGKPIHGEAQGKVHDALVKTLESQLKGTVVAPAIRHGSIHASIVYDKE